MELNKSNVNFDNDRHEYTLGEKKLSGVTPIVKWVYPDTYKNIPDYVLQKAAEYGSMVHAKCEMADRLGIEEEGVVKEYLNIKRELHLATVENEYLVSDEKAIASSIDVVLRDLVAEEDNTVVLADIKTTSTLHMECVRLQLSIYAYLFMLNNPKMKVSKLFAFWLPKPQYGKSGYKEVKCISAELVERILKAYINGEDGTSFAPLIEAEMKEERKEEGELMSDDEVAELVDIEKTIARLKERETEIKSILFDRLKKSGEKKWGNDLLTLTLKAASTRITVDSKKLKEAYPDVYDDCSKISEIAESLTVKVL